MKLKPHERQLYSNRLQNRYYHVLAVQVIPYATENPTENSHICGYCDRSFPTNWSLDQHRITCQTRKNTLADPKDAQELLNTEAQSPNSVTTKDNLTMPCVIYIWGMYKDSHFEKHLSTVYKKQCFGRQNFFLMPFGKGGRKFIEEVSRFMDE